MVWAMAALAMAQGGETIYVSPRGNDAWNGRAEERRGENGPFRTLDRAVREVERLRMLKVMRHEPIRVVLRGGTYALGKPLEIGSSASGTPQSPTVLEAFPGERPLLSGGVTLRGWAPDGQGRLRLQTPEAAGGGWRPLSLFLGDRRLPRARLPKSGWLRVAEPMQPTGAASRQGHDRFRFKPGDLDPSWQNLQDREVLAVMIWGMARLRIRSIEGDVVTFTGATGWPDFWASFQKDGRYLVENAPEGLDEPGEWVLDSRTGTFTAIPPRGVRSFEPVAPRLERLVVVRDARHVSFRGLEFRHAATPPLPPEGRNWPQAESDLPGALLVERSSNVSFVGCTVADVEGYAVELGDGAQDCAVESCRLWRLGAGGVKIGTLSFSEDEARIAQRNIVRGCTIVEGGRLHPAGVGVFIGQSPRNTVERNEIADLYYTGVSVGWSWGYQRTNSHHNRVAFNRIHHIGQGLLSDMGGVYHLGPAPGTEICFNLIHDVQSHSYGGWGLYTDEGSSEVRLYGNVVYRTKSAGFHQHYGKENVVSDNVLALGGEAQVMRTREEPHLSFTFERNIVYWSDAPLLGGNWRGNNHYRFDRNLYWKVGGGAFDFAGWTLEEWRARGQDRESRVLDPGFVDPLKGDFRLKPNSVARGLGYGRFESAFEPWRGKPEWKVRPSAFPLER
ncbi:MAG: right-handed parallel beta-helix repeat-containing protein [Fimbriimonadales bacterium]|nr:right-handed parallel beta-helix repeat-containing protein [Fimbriimonadales bacterium]